MLDIYVDADACPVKDEVYRVARRHGLKVVVVSQGRLHVPTQPGIRWIRVGQEFDASDDWIAEHVVADDIVITADIPLASRCLAKKARPIAPNGQAFTEDSIGNALANRELMDNLRQMGLVTGGPAPFARADRSRFLSRLEETIRAIQRGEAGAGVSDL